MCKNVIKNTMARLPWVKKAEFNIRLTLVRAAKRQRLWVEQDGKCHYCDQETILPRSGQNNRGGNVATLDHIITQSNGGTDSLNNLVVACHTCNSNRLDMDYEIFYNLMKTPGAWKEHCAEMARQKAARDEERRKANLRRHEELLAMEKAAASARQMERLRKHAPNVIKFAQREGFILPADPEERIQWAINYHLEQARLHKMFGPNGDNLLKDWIHRSNFAPRKDGRGWVAIQECSSRDPLPWRDLTGETEFYTMN